MTTRSMMLWLCALALSFTATRAWARCNEGSRAPCVGAGGCVGERECNGGALSRCLCEPTPVPCVICGNPSTRTASGVCRPLPETCNGCDDDKDGVADEDIFCQGTGPFTARCVATTPGVPLPITLGSLDAQLPYVRIDTETSTYAPDLSYQARIHTNARVASLSLHFDTNDVDAFDTFLAFNRVTGRLTDLHGPAWSTFQFPLNGFGQANGVDLNFGTDHLVNRAGWRAYGASVTCLPSPSSSGTALLAEDGADTFGVLAVSDDVIYFHVPVGAEPLSVWVDAPKSGSTLDVDLYARYDALPERNVYDFASTNTNSGDEWINIDAPIAGHTLFLAVHSRRGAGGFNIRTARVKPQHRYARNQAPGRPLRVQTSFAPTAIELARIKDVLGGTQRFMIAVTEGKVQLRDVDLYVRQGDCTCDGLGCDLCFRGIEDRGFCQPGGMATIFRNDWDHDTETMRFSNGARMVTHELGHCLLGLNDEYRDHGTKDEACFHGDITCTASVMGNHRVASNFCNTFEHGRNVSRPGHTCGTCPWTPAPWASGQTCTQNACNSCFRTDPSTWDRLVSSGHVFSKPQATPNNSSYELYRNLPFSVTLR